MSYPTSTDEQRKVFVFGLACWMEDHWCLKKQHENLLAEHERLQRKHVLMIERLGL